MELFKIGFFPVRLVDIIDISVVTFMFYKLYEYMKGSLAVRVTSVILATFLLWKVVGLLEFRLLTTILDAFLGLGAIAVMIIFAPEIRHFLSEISKNTLLDRLLRSVGERTDTRTSYFDIIEAVRNIRGRGEGALIILPGNNPLLEIAATGERLDANITARLIFSIFQKESPLHDGGMVIANGKISSVRCILPLSKDPQLAPDLGLRHRAALGLAEVSDALVLVISEERQEISLATHGTLIRDVDYQELERHLQKHLGQGV